VIHEGQLTYEDVGLRGVVDLGAWWKQETGLPLPMGGNAIRRDLGDRRGEGHALNSLGATVVVAPLAQSTTTRTPDSGCGSAPSR